MLNREACNLRPVERGDLEKLLQWRNSDRIRMNMYTDHIISMDEHISWFEKSQNQNVNVHLVFEVDKKPVGLVYFKDIDENNGRSNWGFYIGETNHPRGSGTALGVLGLQYAFTKLNLRKVCGEAFAFNEASIKFHKKLGFVEEGRLVKHILKHGAYKDIVLFAMFREVWVEKEQYLTDIAFSERGAI